MATRVASTPADRAGIGWPLRSTFLVVGALLGLAGVSTFVLSERTAEYFAWTIQPPVTAAFMGAGYWSTIALVLVAARAPGWAYARVAVPASLGFSALILLATALHFDRFHAGRPITWAWIAIYVAGPVAIAVFAARERRAADAGPPRTHPLPGWALGVLVVHAAVLLPLGAALFASPTRADVLWPWTLTPLTGRVVGAYLAALGLAALHALVERDWRRLRPAAAALALFGALQLVTVARYAGAFDRSDARTWLYAGFLVGMLVFGAEALRRGGGSSAKPGRA